ncbi:hypothetical protein [Brasilonema sp. UFV-L1]|uniref:hypothetical protein n=1 Tax=Brasilonema sp. UFV-L1 TaxID=2234130 RepID=UPI00145E5D2F|nr:hypothetical protein [Brasilonema sp. UFV-L1]NMG07058.1 hypothetical protein [Brasilonema sp. UFV-L1]
MNKIELALVVSYLLISCYFLMNWLTFSIRHPIYSPEEKWLDMVVFLTTSVFWFLSIPIYCLEILKTRKLQNNIVIPVLVTLSAFSMYLYTFVTREF